MPSTNYAPNYTNQAPKEPQKSKTDQLFELKKLYDAGILTEEEFNVQKTKILNS
ncbi:SHOCT domain-containing protein [Bacteroides nordii]